jgi:hypothetical protein
MRFARLLLTFDSLPALSAGCLTLLFSSFLAPLYGWTPEFVRYIALANIAYGCYSGILALSLRIKGVLPPWTVLLLAAANGLWALQCFAQAWRLRDAASWLGLGHLILEGIFVGGLAFLEARLVLPAAGRPYQGPRPVSNQGSAMENGKLKE